MTGAGGQASAEYAGLLGVVAVICAALALMAGPPLVGALCGALVAALSGRSERPAELVASAADIADVESALLPSDAAMTPDAALLALAQRHGPAQAGEIADSLLLAAARAAAPALGTTRVYAPSSLRHGSYEPMAATAAGDRDVEAATGTPVVAWVTVAEQRRALAVAFAHHTKASAVALDLIGLIPFAKVPAVAAAAGSRALARAALEELPEGIEWVHRGSTVIELLHADDGGVPPGMRAGDVVVAWPVHRTFWRDGRDDRQPGADYEHRIVLRPGPEGLRVVAEEVGT